MRGAALDPCSGLTATLPAARRSDSGHTPYGIAILPSGQAVKTAAALVGDVATVTAVSGATAYAVQYYPQLTVWALRPSASGNRGDASHRWELVCEEVQHMPTSPCESVRGFKRPRPPLGSGR